MDKRPDVQQAREEFLDFLGSEKRYWEFELPVQPEDRVQYVHDVITPGIQRLRFYARFCVARLAQTIDYSPVKVLLYRSIGVRIGKGVFISPDVFIDPHFPKLVEIRDYAILGWGAKLFCHELSTGKYRLGRISVGAGAVIGAYSTLRSGISVGEGAETVYQSIVVRDIPDGGRSGLGGARGSL